jgi:hypothetical protein
VVDGNKVIKELGYQFIYPDPLQFKYDTPREKNA